MRLLNILALAGAAATPAIAISGTATTTRYYDGQAGACGCGTGTGNGNAFSWQTGLGDNIYTAAGSQALYGSGTWCGSGCGTCYNVTSTGKAPCSSCGTGGSSGKSIILMVTNLCPNNGNAQWCPNTGGSNQYGYQYHFDIMATSPVIGDNSVVTFNEVACPSQASTDYSQCQCHGK